MANYADDVIDADDPIQTVGEFADETPQNVASLVPIDPNEAALIRPAAPVGTIVEIFEQYQELIKKLLDKSDYQQIGNRTFPKKSAWRKLSAALGVSFEITDRQIHLDDDGMILRADFVVRAIAPRGRFAEGWGACSRYERCCNSGCNKRHEHCPAALDSLCPGIPHFSHAEHDIPATAETRAKNRAASDLFGMGEVSAEEVVSGGGGNQGRGARSGSGKGPKSESPPPAFQKKDPNHEHTWGAPPSGRTGIEACTECGETRKVS